MISIKGQTNPVLALQELMQEQNGHWEMEGLRRLFDEIGVLPKTEQKQFEQLDVGFWFELVAKLADILSKTNSSKDSGLVELIHSFLNIVRLPVIQQKIYAAGKDREWFDQLLKLIDGTNFTLAKLFEQRAEQYSGKPLFQTVRNGKKQDYLWYDVRKKIYAIIKSLITIQESSDNQTRVAILSENSVDMACFDLACLMAGVVDVPIPANSTSQNISFILDHSKSTILFISDEKRFKEFRKIKTKPEALEQVIMHNINCRPEERWFVTFDEFLEVGRSCSINEVQQVMARVQLDDLATIMYTSGTTEKPKGIRFSQRNIISKRFARAIALPDICDRDKFICYLPLFHTFGRYFEMVGCIFWGATYIFLESTHLPTIIKNMRITHPTVFISIPKKWIQLYERVQELISIENAEQNEIKAVVRSITGRKLKWGLSAAGYLDPDVFRFFQGHGIEIMSGFGMTEATGGITMTPPFNYRSNSVGKALPGIEIKLAKDGEMQIRGPYVMIGYLDANSGLESGWMRTGDIFRQDAEGYFQIIDRKKEIYKNSRGETIAPQKIENLFRDFDVVKRVFLVGDHQEYNTLLLYPNYDYALVNFKKLSHSDLRSFFSSLIVSVNQFLAPFERITDFAIIGRDISTEFGELTPKGTYKRKIVEENFNQVIKALYDKNYLLLKIANFDFRIPTWFLREKALTADDVKIRKDSLVLVPLKKCMKVKLIKAKKPRQLQIGSLIYSTSEDHLDLADILGQPKLCLGNMELELFAGNALFRHISQKRISQTDVQLVPGEKISRVKQSWLNRFEQIVEKKEKTIAGIHLAACLIQTWNEKRALKAINYLEEVIQDWNDKTCFLAKSILMRTAHCKSAIIKQRAFQVLMLNEHRDLLQPVLETFLLSPHHVLDNKTIEKLSTHTFSTGQLGRFLTFLAQCREQIDAGKMRPSNHPISDLLRFLTAYGIKHPLSYKIIRTALVQWLIFPSSEIFSDEAEVCQNRLTQCFRDWLGKNLSMAIDYEHKREFSWQDVISFDNAVPQEHQNRLTVAIKNLPLIREAVLLFSNGRMLHLYEIQNKGITISKLGSLHGKSVYRVSVQTHHYGSFDLAINLNHSLSTEEIESEIKWLISASATELTKPLAEEFGGYWPEYDLWTEEFIPGDTVEKFLEKQEEQDLFQDEEQIRQIWTSFVWNGVSAYIDFWNRTGRTLEIADPTPANVIVPSHDYQIGYRIVAISKRKPFKSITDMLLSFRSDFVEVMENRYPVLRGFCKWAVLFSAFLEILGENAGLQLFKDELELISDSEPNAVIKEMRVKLLKFVRAVDSKGYKTVRLYFAIQRFKRWFALNPDATAQAQIQTLYDLRITYVLDKVEKHHPGSRIQFFRDTVFAASNNNFRLGLTRAMREMKKKSLTYYDLQEQLAELGNKYEVSPDEKIFLTRLSYPHLGVQESAEMISLAAEGSERTTLVVFSTDDQGNSLAIRNPVSPKEIARLHKLFTAAKLPVEFSPEHKFMVIIDSRGIVIGGLFYRFVSQNQVHLEKVVVDEHSRTRSVSASLLQEFFNRIRSYGVETVTVGFLRPEFFYRFGFRIDHRYGNMVKRLEEELDTAKQSDLIEQIV